MLQLNMETTMDRTLWAFGDSHTRGASLSLHWDRAQCEKWFLENTGYTNFEQGILLNNSLSMNKKNRLMINWAKSVNFVDDPDLTYAGVISKKLGTNYINLAKNGHGLDSVVLELNAALPKINIQKDIVIVGLPSFARYLGRTNRGITPYNINSYNEMVFPSDFSLKHLYMGLISRIKNIIPNAKFIKINKSFIDEVNLYSEYDNLCINKYDMHNLSDSSGSSGQYPDAHFIEEIHELLAAHILETCQF